MKSFEDLEFNESGSAEMLFDNGYGIRAVQFSNGTVLFVFRVDEGHMFNARFCKTASEATIVMQDAQMISSSKIFKKENK